MKNGLIGIVVGLFVLALALPAQAEEEIWLEGENQRPKVELKLPSFAPITEHLGKAVVNISTEGEMPVARRGGSGEEAGRSPFDFFFQNPHGGRRSYKTHSLGSGFVINPDGYIVTNNHVVERASKIVVNFRDDKRSYTAKVVGKDTKTDLALLKIDSDKKFDAVVFGDSTTLDPGDWVIAIGNPFRLGHTVTVGIVSATSRKVPGGGPYDDFIQTDASINPGNSGGPLFNSKGEVVGVNTAIYSPGSMGAAGFNIGIGFAIPSNLVKNIISQLHENGKVVRGWLGVLIQPVSEDVADAMKLKSVKGALIADVIDGSPAAKAKFKRGDVIVTFDGEEVEENADLPLMVAQTEINKKVPVEVIRGGKRKTITVLIEELDDGSSKKAEKTEEEALLGMSVQDLTPDIAKSLNIEETKGVVVSGVLPGGVAESAGLRRGDVILEVSSKPVSDSKSFHKLTGKLKANEPILLLIRRGQNTVFLTLKLE